MKEIKQKMIADKVPDVKINRSLEILKRVYIAQHIRNEGVLQSTFSGYYEEINILKEYNLIKENKWYSHELYLTTEEGEKIASQLVEGSLQKFRNIIDIISRHKLSIPLTTLQFLIFDYFITELTFPTGIEKEYTFDWREPILEDVRIKKVRDEILNILEKEGLCVKTNMYVSTGGGKLREDRYVISPEVQSLLTENWAIKGGLEEDKKKISRIYIFLKEIEHVLRSDRDIETIREVFWEKLKQYKLSEEDIHPIVNVMSKEGITSTYKGILSTEKPFVIKNATSYKIYLEKRLIKPLVDEILETKKPEAWKLEKPKEKHFLSIEELRKEKEKFIGRISFEDLTRLFIEIVTFEIKMRSLIKRRLEEKFGREWWYKIPAGVRNDCQGRKKKDIKEGWEPEKELLNYADFSDYKKIIMNHWDLFKGYFRNDQSKAKTYLDDINNLGRKRVMHIRTITPEAASMVKQQIKWLSESIDIRTS